MPDIMIFFFLALLQGVIGNPIANTSTIPPTSTSSQWLIISGTSVFWPTSTNYFYGPTDGPEASAVICNAEWVEFDARASGLQSLGPTGTTTFHELYPTSTGACSTSILGETWGDTHTGPVTTLCDGHTRALGPRETITHYYPGPGDVDCSTFASTFTGTDNVYLSPSPTPTCSLQTEDCYNIWSTYNSRYTEYINTRITLSSGDTGSPIRPSHCPTVYTTRTYPEANPCSACHFLPGKATMFYWPVTTTSGDLCLQDGSTLPATPTDPPSPNSAIVDGYTMISPSIYVSFTSIYAWSNRRGRPGSQCGDYLSNQMLSAHPTALSSVRHHRNARNPIYGTVYPFNFAEFQPQPLGEYTQPLIPWERYEGGQQCPIRNFDTCTMVRDDYAPWLYMPEEILQIEPRWSNCHRGWYIPPVTMVPLVDGGATWTTTAGPEETEMVDGARVMAVATPALATPVATGGAVEVTGEAGDEGESVMAW